MSRMRYKLLLIKVKRKNKVLLMSHSSVDNSDEIYNLK